MIFIIYLIKRGIPKVSPTEIAQQNKDEGVLSDGLSSETLRA
jgi:hypothetical protein